MNTDTAIFGDLLLSTLNARMDQINMKSLSRKSLTLAMLQSKAIYESGKAIEVKFRKDRLPVGSYSGYDSRPMEHKELFAGGQIGWKTNDVTVVIDEETLVLNSGLNIAKIMQYKSINRMPAMHQHTLFDIFQKYHMAALEDLEDEVAKQVFGNGYNDEGQYKDIEGFPVFMAYDQPYAGLSPDDKEIGRFDRVSVSSGERDKIWNPRYVNLNNERAVTQLDFANLGSDIRRGAKTSPVYVAMSEEHYNNLEYIFEGDKRRDEVAVHLGYKQNMYYERLNMTFYPEDYIEDGTIYGWMPEHVKLVKNRDLNMQFSGVMVQLDRNVIVYRYKDMCNLRCDSRAHCFIIENALP